MKQVYIERIVGAVVHFSRGAHTHMSIIKVSAQTIKALFTELLNYGRHLSAELPYYWVNSEAGGTGGGGGGGGGGVVNSEMILWCVEKGAGEEEEWET